MAYVGGRGYGKTAMQQRMAEEFKLTKEMLEEALNTPLYPWQQAFIKGQVIGHWEYTPRDELRHRLNQRLQGKDPGLPINTRFWRDQK
jgi:hypothetical protein